MGKQERAAFKAELEKLEKISARDRHESDDYLAQNARTAAAEKKISLVENLWVRGQVG